MCPGSWACPAISSTLAATRPERPGTASRLTRCESGGTTGHVPRPSQHPIQSLAPEALPGVLPPRRVRHARPALASSRQTRRKPGCSTTPAPGNVRVATTATCWPCAGPTLTAKSACSPRTTQSELAARSLARRHGHHSPSRCQTSSTRRRARLPTRASSGADR